MTARYAFDIHPAGDETGSLPLVRLSPDDNLVSGEYTHVGYGLGSGELRIHADHPDATAENFARRNYVRFLRVDTDPEQAIGSFFLESGDFAALSRREQGGRILTFRGPGALSILDRYKLGQAIYAPGQPYRGSHNEIGKWTWENVAYGAIMVRAIEEGQNNSDVLPYPPFNAVTLGFTRSQDSNGDAWETLGDYQTDIGESVLELYSDLARHGIVVQVDADLMISGYKSKADFGVDRTSLTFAAGKARFEGGVNIAGEIPKRIHASVERSHVLTKRKDGLYQTFGLGYPGGVVGSGVVYFDFIDVPQTSDAAAVARVAEAHLDRLAAYVDQATVRHVIGDGVGEYAPGPAGDYWVLDLVTLDTGDGEQDFDDAPIEVASIRFYHDDAGNWMVETELGAEYVPPEVANFQERIVTQVRTTAGGRIELCQPVQVIEEGIQRVGTIAISSAHIDSDDWPDGVEVGDVVVLELSQVGISGQIPAGASGWTNHGSGGVTSDGPGGDVGFRLVSMVLDAGDLIDTTGWTHTNTERMVGAVYRNVASLTGLVAETISTGSSGLFEWPAVPTTVDDLSSWVFLGGHSNIDAGIGTPDGFASLGTAIGDANGVAQSWDSDGGIADYPGGSVALSPASAWQCHGIELVASGGTSLSSTGDGHEDLVGTGGKAARCDHMHMLIADTAPTVDDDGVHGIPRGTLWCRLDDVDTPTDVVAMYVSADDTDGAAVWLELPTGSGSAAFVGARAYASGTQSISNGSGDTPTAATLGSEEYDTDGFHSTVTNTSRMTVPSGKAGTYRIRGHAFFAANATGIRFACLLKNGSKVRGSATRTLVPGSTGGISCWAEATIPLAVGDYVELGVYQTSGGSLTIGHATLTEIQTVLEIEYVGA